MYVATCAMRATAVNNHIPLKYTLCNSCACSSVKPVKDRSLLLDMKYPPECFMAPQCPCGRVPPRLILVGVLICKVQNSSHFSGWFRPRKLLVWSYELRAMLGWPDHQQKYFFSYTYLRARRSLKTDLQLRKLTKILLRIPSERWFFFYGFDGFEVFLT